MAQITLYLDEETERRMKSAAEGAGLSMSRWVGDLIRERTASDWPASILELAGAWKDLPEAEEIRSSSCEDVARESS